MVINYYLQEAAPLHSALIDSEKCDISQTGQANKMRWWYQLTRIFVARFCFFKYAMRRFLNSTKLHRNDHYHTTRHHKYHIADMKNAASTLHQHLIMNRCQFTPTPFPFHPFPLPRLPSCLALLKSLHFFPVSIPVMSLGQTFNSLISLRFWEPHWTLSSPWNPISKLYPVPAFIIFDRSSKFDHPWIMTWPFLLWAHWFHPILTM